MGWGVHLRRWSSPVYRDGFEAGGLVMKRTLVGLGLFLIVTGVYFLPFMNDIVIWALMEIFGSYWNGILALYAITIAMIFAGIGLAAKNFPLGPLSFMRHPGFIIAVLLGAAAMLYILYKTPLGG